LTYATNKSKKLKLHYKYYIKEKKHKEKRRKEKTLKVNIKELMIGSSHKDSDREGTKSIFRHFCPDLPLSLTFCAVR